MIGGDPARAKGDVYRGVMLGDSLSVGLVHGALWCGVTIVNRKRRLEIFHRRRDLSSLQHDNRTHDDLIVSQQQAADPTLYDYCKQ